ncbi:MAG: hypothetical protein CM1200mP2_54890 [Planctomycetaceae bacterium]|nr:MAG: hypothetical protein CM1200mP2_54890 [Planctomycetaceae bacterium]
MNQIHFSSITNVRSPGLEDHKILSICATTTAASEKWIGYGTKADIMANLAKHNRIKFDYIEDFVRGLPVSIRTHLLIIHWGTNPVR